MKEGVGVLELWSYGTAWIHSPKKDFAEGYKIFSKIIAAKVISIKIYIYIFPFYSELTLALSPT